MLGLSSALGGIIFYRLLYFSEDAWARIRFPEPLKPVLGGIILGTVGIYTYQLDGVPRIFGVGSHTIEEAYEVADAIQRNDMAALLDELGDLLFQVVFHSRIARRFWCQSKVGMRTTNLASASVC